MRLERYLDFAFAEGVEKITIAVNPEAEWLIGMFEDLGFIRDTVRYAKTNKKKPAAEQFTRDIELIYMTKWSDRSSND
jgi:hypothetical protein